jgi:hypothetical protein
MTTRAIQTFSILLVIVGFLLPLWELQVVGIILAGISGRYLVAFLLGLVVDIAYGPPTGVLHATFFPFTLLALLSIGIFQLGKNFVLDKTFPGKI